MGRRSVNTTKSGKYMNPTDQARKIARRKELKKNKKQRMTVRMAVLKSKDPRSLLEEIKQLDIMEFDTTQAPQLNERVLREKRRKLKETYERVFHMYEKEDPETAVQLKRTEQEYEKNRAKLQLYYEQVKNAEKVNIDMIPLPDAPGFQATDSTLPPPNEIPLPSVISVQSILKKSGGDRQRQIGPSITNPPGPPPGPPPSLSDNENEEEGRIDEEGKGERRGRTQESNSSKSRKIRFQDDDVRDPNEDEKDTRVKYKARNRSGVTRFSEEPSRESEKQKERQIDDDKEEEEEEEEEEEWERRKNDREVERDRIGVQAPPMMFRLPPPSMGIPMAPPGPPPRMRPPMVNPNLVYQHPGIPRPPIGVVSALPNINKQQQQQQQNSETTISAKPKIRNLIGDATKFLPTAVKIRRQFKDDKGNIINQPARQEDPLLKPFFTHHQGRQEAKQPYPQPPTTDDAYESFMKEMQRFL